MTKYQTALIDCIGASDLDKAVTIAEKHCSLDATSESMVYIDLSSPNEVLNELVDAEIIDIM